MSQHSVGESSDFTQAARREPRGLRVPESGLTLGLAVLGPGATLLGTGLGRDLQPAALQIAAAVAVSLTVLSVIPLALRTRSASADPAVALAAVVSAGAAAVHFAVISDHFKEWWVFGVFFIGSGIAQLVWALLIAISPSRPLLSLGAGVNAAIIALWVVTRTVGTLVGPEPHTPEPVGVADTVATGLEIVIVVAALSATKTSRARRMDPNAVWVAGTATTVVTIFALLSVMGAAPHLIPGTE